MTDDYSKSLEDALKKQEQVIEDFIRDRENITKMLGVMIKGTHEICGDIELLANPKNPSGGDPSIIRDVIKKKLLQELKSYANSLAIVSSYAAQDPTEYKVTGKHWAVPVVRTPKDPY
jgi:hypothetical protein